MSLKIFTTRPMKNLKSQGNEELEKPGQREPWWAFYKKMKHAYFEKHSETSVSIRETDVHFQCLTGRKKAVGGPVGLLKNVTWLFEKFKEISVSISTIGVDKPPKRGGRTDRRTDRQTENYLLRAPITWRKYIFLHNGPLEYIFFSIMGP